ncbi:hypothetical protein PDIDSM_1384 [Penicillium digitatum]|nr:hypothetical protein PDIDSM_1384 [Penicillium digitatum]
MENAHYLMGQVLLQNVAMGNILQALEQRMGILIEEMTDLQFEELHDARIAEAIWEDTWDHSIHLSFTMVDPQPIRAPDDDQFEQLEQLRGRETQRVQRRALIENLGSSVIEEVEEATASIMNFYNTLVGMRDRMIHLRLLRLRCLDSEEETDAEMERDRWNEVL